MTLKTYTGVLTDQLGRQSIKTAQFDVTVPATGWPDASNTGHRGTLAPRVNLLSSTANGQVISLKDADFIDIKHSNVTVQNCRTGRVYIMSGKTGCIVEDCTIDRANWNTGVLHEGSGAIIRRCNISRTENAIAASGTFEYSGNYSHDLDFHEGTAHADHVQLFPGVSGFTIKGNNFAGRPADSSLITTSSDTNGTITGNRFQSSTACVRLEDATNDILVEGNTFIGDQIYDYIIIEGQRVSVRNNTFAGVLWPTGYPNH